jgi:hypothetical protein
MDAPKPKPTHKMKSLLIMLLVAMASAKVAPVSPDTAPARVETRVKAPTLTKPEKVVAAAIAEIGVTEATGKNDGPRVEFYQKKTGNKKGDPWCASFVYAVSWLALGDATPYPRSGWSPDFVAGGKPPAAIMPAAACVGFYYPALKRNGHVELIISDNGGKYVTTVGGNTSRDGAGVVRDGGTVARKMRLRSSIYRYRVWL